MLDRARLPCRRRGADPAARRRPADRPDAGRVLRRHAPPPRADGPAVAAQRAAPGRTSRPTGAGTGPSSCSSCCSSCRWALSSSPTTGRSSCATTGRRCSRSSSTIPEEKFGGFLAETDYRDPIILDEIEANGWALWPPVRYSYRTVNREVPTAAPSRPAFLFDSREELCAALSAGRGRSHVRGRQLQLAGHGRPGARRDGASRLRLPHLGPVRSHPSPWRAPPSASRRAPYRAITAGGTDLIFQRFIEIWSSIPTLYVLLIMAAVLPQGFWILLGIPSPVLLGRAGGRGARRVPSRAQLRVRQRRARALGGRQRHHHHAAPPAQRHGGDAHVPALHPVGLDHHADLARLSRLRPAAGLGQPGRAAQAGAQQSPGALAGASPASSPSRSCSACSSSSARRCATRSTHGRRSSERARDGRSDRGGDGRPPPLRAPTCRSPSAARRPSTACPSTSRRARRWRWWASRARASRSPPCRSSSSCPTPPPRTPRARFGWAIST